jgi:hypothetical protein
MEAELTKLMEAINATMNFAKDIKKQSAGDE